MGRMRHEPCPDPTCPHLRPRGGDCPDGHGRAQRRASQIRTDARRPTASRRGYGATHRTRFRGPVLQRDPICVLCREAPSTVADHHPLTRRQLVAQGLDPNDPKHGRGLCGPCHSAETAKHDGGFGRALSSPAEKITTCLDDADGHPHAP